MAGTIFLFTDYYPYGKEEVFVDNELNSSAAEHYDIYVVPFRKRPGIRPLPSSATLVEDVVEASFFTRMRAMVRTIFSRHLLLVPFEKPRPSTLRHWKNAVGGIYRGHLLYYCIKKNRHLYRDADLLYSYWCDNTLIGLALATDEIETLAETPVICRAHGFDVYGRERGLFFPAREYALSRVDNVISVSRAGAEHLRELYPRHSHKISTMYIGVEDAPHTRHLFSPQELRIVSCSNVIPLKRTHLIASMLKRYATEHPDVPIHWTHFGDGVCMNELKAATASLPQSMTVTLRGATPNARLLNEYALGAYDIFISMSSSEGIPVSVMEAMAYGIVPLCTDAGGTREAITPETGVLLPLEASYDDFCRGIEHIKEHWQEMSSKAIKRQRSYFSLQSNFAAFYRFVARLIH